MPNEENDINLGNFMAIADECSSMIYSAYEKLQFAEDNYLPKMGVTTADDRKIKATIANLKRAWKDVEGMFQWVSGTMEHIEHKNIDNDNVIASEYEKEEDFTKWE